MDFDRKFYISYVVILCMQNVKFDKGKKNTHQFADRILDAFAGNGGTYRPNHSKEAYLATKQIIHSQLYYILSLNYIK